MRQSYLDYAMSVIVGRALPDVRDGLKPVHRRILFAMHEQSNTFDKPYKKSARIVGDVIGKYHPHGDSAVYDAMVRMAQEFSMRAPLVDGQGNFGSVDGDAPAAMRYTEVRLSKLANELLADLEKETVDWMTNYDDSLEEPLVLPTKVPNLLLNGSSGIAVGMATNIPPHNLGELCDALTELLANPDTTPERLHEIIPGPDFPTGGIICGLQPIREAYLTGRGVLQVRAKVHFEETRRERQAIIVTELPYQVNKARLIEKIAQLVKDKHLEGIADLRDESDRDGMRMVIEVKRGEQPEIILNRLYKTTLMQASFGVNAVALRDGQPQLLTLKDMLQAFLEHREEVVLRRSRFELRKARERAHILEGLVKALDHLDEVITLIRESVDPERAREGLMSRFEFSEVQARAILDMRLQRLTGLERDKIVAEYKDVLARIAELEAILRDRTKVLAIIGEEIAGIRVFATPRRTEIVPDRGDVSIEDLIADDDMVVMLTHRGYVKRTSLEEFREQRRGGTGKTGMGTRDEDWVEELFVARAHSTLMFFTDLGRVYWLKVYELPETSRTAKGTPIVNLLQLQQGEKVSTVIEVRDFAAAEDLFFVTSRGTVKRTPLPDYANQRKGGIHAIRLDDDDRLVSVLRVQADDEIVLVTHLGQSIRFDLSDVRQMGRVTRGVRGISLRNDDYVVAGIRAQTGIEILPATELAYGKRTPVEEYRKQTRGGKGVLTMRLTEKTGRIVGALPVEAGDQVMLVTDTGRVVRFDVDTVSQYKRDTQGVRLMKMRGDEHVAGVARVVREEGDESVDGEVGEGADAETTPDAATTPGGEA
jgi:DNA gyrase subunit A